MNDRRFARRVAMFLLYDGSERDKRYWRAFTDVTSVCHAYDFDLDAELEYVRWEIRPADRKLEELARAIWFAMGTIPNLKEGLLAILGRNGGVDRQGRYVPAGSTPPDDSGVSMTLAICVVGTVGLAVVIFQIFF